MQLPPDYIGRFFMCVRHGKEGTEELCLPPIEIVPIKKEKEFIAGNAAGRTTVDYEPYMNPYLENKIMKQVLSLHRRIGLKGMSRTDVRVNGDDVFYSRCKFNAQYGTE